LIEKPEIEKIYIFIFFCILLFDIIIFRAIWRITYEKNKK
tara:strand:- start:853 stop:972 length:120 start_codon:yes stop_codon:yes gene_type:complete